MTEPRNDLEEILESFTKGELAAYMARSILTNGGSTTIDKASLLRNDRPAPLVAKTTDVSDGVIQIHVHEAQRDEGYYIVYEASYARNVVAYWSAREAAWFTTHECADPVPSSVSVVGPPLNLKEAANGR